MTFKELRKQNYKKGRTGARRNEENTYWIIVSRTKEKLQGFRIRWAAQNEINRWEEITFEECEVI